MTRCDYRRPTTPGDPAKLLGKHAAACAGGTDLLDRMKERLVEPRRLVDLKGGALDGRIEITGDGPARRLRIGALATLAEVAGNPLVGPRGSPADLWVG